MVGGLRWPSARITSRRICTARDFHDGLADVLAGKRAQLSLEYPCDAPHQARWFRATAARYEGPDGRLHVAVSHADITARRAAEDRLQEHAQLLSSFMRHSPICAYIKEVSPTESRVVHASENLKDITGLPSASMVGKPMTQLFPPELAASMTAADWQVASGGQVLRVEEELAGRQYASVKFPLGPNLMGGYTVDVTDQRALEAQRQQSHKAASLGVMAAGIAHQFNNLLTIIQAHLEQARAAATPDEPTLLAEAEDASRRAATISGSLLSYLGQGSHHAEPRALGHEVTALLPLLRASMPATVALEVETSSAGPTCTVDPTAFRRVLVNLVTNAAEAAALGGHSVRIALRAQLGDPPGACLEVSDNGPGMDATTRERIFDPFFSTKLTGRGLGLPVSLGLVRAAGGTLEVDSEPGRGTTVRVLLPASTAEELTHQPLARAASLIRRVPRPGAVLVVDDDPLVLKASRRALQQQGHMVVSATSGPEALSLFEAQGDRIGAAVVDLSMPGMDGWQVLAALRQRRADLFVVVVSGYDVAELCFETREVEPDRWLQKPFSSAQLTALLSQPSDRAD
jgi:signal transduction histidine kinase